MEHAPFGFHQWSNTTDNPSQDTVLLTYTFGNSSNPDPKLKNIFDVNGNGIVDDDERLFNLFDWYNLTGYHTPSQGQVLNGFEGFMNIDNIYTADISKYTIGGSGIVPEPSRAILLGLGLGSLLLNRRRTKN